MVSLCEQDVKRLNRVADFFGDPLQRWNDRLTLERCSYIEEYCRGRLALVLHCYGSVVGVAESNGRGFVHDVNGPAHPSLFIILKADIGKTHKLEHWDKKLMFIPNIESVKSPQGGISSLVGFNCFKEYSGDCDADLLLFQSTVNGVYKSLPRIENWEIGPSSYLATATKDNVIPQMVNGAVEVMESITDSQRSPIYRKSRFVNFKMDEIYLPFAVVLNRDCVEVRIREVGKHSLNLIDVLAGPLNLQP